MFVVLDKEPYCADEAVLMMPCTSTSRELEFTVNPMVTLVMVGWTVGRRW